MFITRHISALILCILAISCVSGKGYDRAFSNDWVHQHRHDAEFRARKERMQQGEIVIAGKSKNTQAAIRMDDKGRPRFNLGRKRGISADLDLHHGEPDVKVKYKIRW